MKLIVKSAANVRAEHRAKRMADLSAVRWQHQVGGLTLPDGAFIRTDDATRAALTQAISSFATGAMTGAVPWKMADGSWQDLSEPDLIAINTAVAGHVQACFAAERAVSTQIDATSDPAGFDVVAAFAAAI